MRREFPYRTDRSEILGAVRTPVLDISLFSIRYGIWIPVENVIADTGADDSVFPMDLGRHLLGRGDVGKRATLSGIVPGRPLSIHLHTIRIRIARWTFRALVGFALHRGVPPILGRYQALDRFTAVYTRGKKLTLVG